MSGLSPVTMYVHMVLGLTETGPWSLHGWMPRAQTANSLCRAMALQLGTLLLWLSVWPLQQCGILVAGFRQWGPGVAWWPWTWGHTGLYLNLPLGNGTSQCPTQSVCKRHSLGNKFRTSKNHVWVSAQLKSLSISQQDDSESKCTCCQVWVWPLQIDLWPPHTLNKCKKKSFFWKRVLLAMELTM